MAVDDGHQFGPFTLAEPAGFRRDLLALHHPLHDGERALRKRHGVEAVLLEGLRRSRGPALQHVQHRLGIDPISYWACGSGAHAEKMHEVVEIDLPVPLGIEIEAQVHPRQFAGETLLRLIDARAVLALVQHLGIVVVDLGGIPFRIFNTRAASAPLQDIAAALAVGGGLPASCAGAGM